MYETPNEFLAAGDFNGDGIADVLVLDRATGNARVGYQQAGGGLNWSPPRPSGVEQAAALAVGRFAHSNRSSIAVTAPALNHIRVLDLSSPTNPPAPILVQPPHAGTTLLLGLDAPYGVTGARSWLNAGSHDPGLTLLDLLAFSLDGLASFQDQIAAEGTLSSVRALRRATNDATLLAAIRRGSHDTFVAYAFTNTVAPVLVRSNLPAGTEYVFGHFNNEPHPRLLFYVPGQSNLLVQPLLPGGANFVFGAAILHSFNSAVQRVYVVEEQTNGLVVVQFAHGGVSGLRVDGGTGELVVSPGFAVTPTAEVLTGVVPLGAGKFAVLSSPSNLLSSTHAQVFTRDGDHYVQTGGGPLSDLSTSATRGNVWLFQLEPFVSSAATLVASLNAPEWSSGANGLPATLSVRVERDGGVTTGLGSPATNHLGAPPPGTAYALPNQYRDDVSFFGYGPPQSPQPAVVTIHPPPGSYGQPISISFIKQNPAHEVRYRVGDAGVWQLYSAPFPLTNDATIQYYGQVSGGERGPLLAAAYLLGNPTTPIAPPVTLPGGETNPPPPGGPVIPQVAAGGTVFYSRASSGIWAIHLDGTGETFITAGHEPRVSPDGRWLAFRRENDPAPNQHSLWLRELPTGQENRWHTRSQPFVGYDWDVGGTNLIFASDCRFWRLGFSGPPVMQPLAGDCRQGAPGVNPVDGRVAFQVHAPGDVGLFVAPPNLATRQKLNLTILSPRWPAWSADGTRLVVADDPTLSASAVAGRDLWVVKLGAQTNVHQITALPGGTNGFPHGAIWSPDGNRLVGAGRIGGVNGLWVIPLAADGSACHCPPRRLPTSPGDDIRFAGTVVGRPASVTYINLGLFIRLEPELLVVYWSTNYDGFVLEAAADLAAGVTWTTVNGPYFRVGPYFEYREPRGALAERRFFRLRSPGVLVLTPVEPPLGFHRDGNDAVLTWPLNYFGYALEATTNLSPPVRWAPLPGPYSVTNGAFEYRRALPGPPQEFYRLRLPR